MANPDDHARAALSIIYQPKAGDHSIDVVLVEGLGGQSSSQTVSGGIDDPTEVAFDKLLQKHVSSARILLFTYSPPITNDEDSDPLFSVEGVAGAADALLKTLRKRRADDKAEWLKNRPTDEDTEAAITPLSFIAHDLGGAIVKKALVTAAHDTRYSELAKAATRLIFIGTPHDALSLLSWEDTLLNIFLSFPRRAPLPRNLATRARSLAIFLQSLSDQFRAMSGRRSLTSVYEQYEPGSHTDTVSSTVIHSRSISTGLLHEIGIPRKVGLHRLSRFSNDDESRAIASSIWGTITSEISSEDYRACLDSLYALSSPTSFAWQDSKSPLYGLPSYSSSPPSTTDSTASTSTITCVRFTGFWQETLRSPVGICPLFAASRHGGARRSGAYFSFSNCTDGRSTISVAFLSSIAFQILNQDRASFAKVQNLFAAMRASNNWTHLALSVLLSLLLRVRDESDTQYIFIDGFDNCEAKTRQSLLDFVVSHVNDKKLGARLKVTFSIVDMSADIEEALNRCVERVAREDQSTDPSDAAIRDCASQILADNFLPSSLEQHIFEVLKRCKTTTDLLFTVDSLRRTDSTDSPRTKHQMESLMMSLPGSVELSITARFHSLQRWSRCALGWMLSARRPMKIGELCTAVALTIGGSTFDERSLPLIPRLILESDFGPLVTFTGDGAVTVRSGEVRNVLVNLIDSEYRKKSTMQHMEAGKESLARSASIPGDLQITEILLEYLCRDDLIGPVKQALRTTDPFVQPSGHLFQLIVYAVELWPTHYRNAEDEHGVGSKAMNRVLELIEDSRLARIWPMLNDKICRILSPPDVCLLDPLSFCAQLGLTTVVKRLQTSAGVTARQAAMNAASWGGHDHIVEMLLQGSQTGDDDPRWDVSKALEYASACGHDQIIYILLDYRRSSNGDISSLDHLMCQAARLGYAHQVSVFFHQGCDVNAAPEGMTPLQYAAECGHSAVVELLVKEVNADVKGRGWQAATPLMLAAENGHKSVVEILLQSNVYTRDDFSPDDDDDDILMSIRLAAKAGQLATVDLLLTYITNSSGEGKLSMSSLLRDSLLAAVHQGHVKIVEKLLEKGADPAVGDEGGHTPLYHALAQGHGVLAGRILQHVKLPRDLKDIGEIFLRSCAEGQYKIIHWCLTDNPELKNHRGDQDETALHLASKAGYTEIVRDLLALKPDVDVNDLDGWTPLTNAAAAGEVGIVELLLEHGAKANKTTSEGQDVLMTLANAHKSPRVAEVVRILLDNGADPNSRGMWDWTPLLQAASKGNLEMVRSLLEHQGVDQVEPNATGRWGWNALHTLANNNEYNKDEQTISTEIAELLIVAGTNPLERDSDGWIPLHLAARSGNLPLLQFLRNKHPDSLATTAHDGRTVLDFGYSYPSVVRWTLSQQNLVNINQTDKGGETPLMRLARVGNAESTRLFMEEGADPGIRDGKGRTALHIAAYYGRLEVAQTLLNLKPELLSYRDARNHTPLHWAIVSREPEFAFMLLDQYYIDVEHAREDFKAIDLENGRTPLISAVKEKYNQVIKKLLELGAETEIRDNSGDTALLVAVAGGSESIVELLVNLPSHNGKRVNINAGGGKYHTALYEAASQGNRNVVNQLLLAGAQVNQVGGEYGTALCIACRHERESTISLLLEKGAKISSSGGPAESANALSCAVYSESMSLVEKLLDAGAGEAEINAQDIHGRSAIHIAARWCTWEMIEMLLNKRGDPLKVDKQRRTLLHHAVMGGHARLVSTILSDETLFPQIGVQDVDGWTPLHWACRVSGNLAIVELLVYYGANFRAVAKYGWTPHNIAVFHDQSEIASFVEKKGKERGTTNTDPNENATDEDDVPQPSTYRKWRVAANESTAFCDSCYLQIWGVHWRCSTCRDYDLCFKCYWIAGETHDPEHLPFTRIPEKNGDHDNEPQFVELSKEDPPETQLDRRANTEINTD